MGKIRKPQKVKIFASIIYQGGVDLNAVTRELVQAIGPIEEMTQAGLFTHTTYYDCEMGQGLKRFFVLFQPLFDRDILPDIKIITNDIESSYARNDLRTINIDSGYIALEHVILATTKGYAHRLYVGKGIHGDLTLMFSGGSYRVLPWTYPDYAEPDTIALFNLWREKCKISLRADK
ncbi:MAG: DUF4416 family protein [Syntrophorhabdaceae bacterium]